MVTKHIRFSYSSSSSLDNEQQHEESQLSFVSQANQPNMALKVRKIAIGAAIIQESTRQQKQTTMKPYKANSSNDRHYKTKRNNSLLDASQRNTSPHIHHYSPSQLPKRKNDSCDHHDSDLEVPYAQNLGIPHARVRLLTGKSREPLRAGDVILYAHPAMVAGKRDAIRVTQVLQINPNQDIPLELDNGDILPGDVRVKRVQEYHGGTLYNHPGLLRYIRDFELRKGALQVAQGKLPGLRKQVDRIRAFLTQSQQEMKIVPDTGALEQYYSNDSRDDSTKQSEESSTNKEDEQSTKKMSKAKVATLMRLAKKFPKANTIRKQLAEYESSDSDLEWHPSAKHNFPGKMPGINHPSVLDTSSDDEAGPLKPIALAKKGCPEKNVLSHLESLLEDETKAGSTKRLMLSRNGRSKKMDKPRLSSNNEDLNTGGNSKRKRLEEEIDSVVRKKSKMEASSTGEMEKTKHLSSTDIWASSDDDDSLLLIPCHIKSTIVAGKTKSTIGETSQENVSANTAKLDPFVERIDLKSFLRRKDVEPSHVCNYNSMENSDDDDCRLGEEGIKASRVNLFDNHQGDWSIASSFTSSQSSNDSSPKIALRKAISSSKRGNAMRLEFRTNPKLISRT